MNETSPSHSTQKPESGTPPNEREPRWPAAAALLAVGGLYIALPASLSIGPRWLPLAAVVVMMIPLLITHQRGKHSLNQTLGYGVTAVVTAFMVWSLVLLLMGLPTHKEQPLTLLRSAAALWITNILVFASWYWRLDRGGPHRRDTVDHIKGSFLFPQMTLDVSEKKQAGEPTWSPNFVDYLFLAFNFSTALSPADTAVLSRWAKLLVIVQASISLTVIVILAARSVNIL